MKNSELVLLIENETGLRSAHLSFEKLGPEAARAHSKHYYMSKTINL